jgi:hypothetical protein
VSSRRLTRANSGCLPSAQKEGSGLIATIEIVLAPLSVWLLFAEDPGQATLVGGAIVMAAVIFQLYGELRRPSRAVAVKESAGCKVETPIEIV